MHTISLKHHRTWQQKLLCHLLSTGAPAATENGPMIIAGMSIVVVGSIFPPMCHTVSPVDL